MEPGAIAPGRSLTLSVSPAAPLNVAKETSDDTGETIGSDVASGSNVNAFLLTPSGRTVREPACFCRNSEMVGLLAGFLPIQRTW